MKKKILHLLLSALFILLTACGSTAHLKKPPVQHNALQLKARDYYLNGIFKQQDGDYNEALVAFYQALQYDSSSASIYNSIAENHMKLAHFESAKLYLHKSLLLQPENIEALELLAECDLRLDQDDQAIESFRRILKQNPYDEDARQYLILLYGKKGDEMGVAHQIEDQIKLYGPNKNLLVRLSELYLREKQYDKALPYLNNLLKIDSTSAHVHFLIGQVKDLKNQPEQAAAYYEQALKLDPSQEGARNRLTYYYRNKRDWQAIIRLYRPVLTADSTTRGARILTAEAYYYLNKYNNARRFLLPLLQTPKPDTSLMELMGRIELEGKRPEKAAWYFRKILQQKQNNKTAWIFLSFSLSDMDSLEQAQKTYEQALKLFPEDAGLWSFYGVNLQNQELYNQAILAFKKTLKLDSGNRNALSGLPVVYEALKLYSKCDSMYEVAIRRLPDNALLLNNYSYSLSERNIRLNDALKMAKKAVTAEPDNAAYLDTIGWIYFKLGRFSKAVPYIQKAVDTNDGVSAVVLEHLGDVYAALGKTDLAKIYWEKAITLDPGNNPLRKKLEKIK